MEALNLPIKSRLGTATIEKNDENEGVFIVEPMIDEDLAYPDPENT